VIFDRAPIRSIHVTGDANLVPRLVREGVLARVCWLDLSGLPVNTELLGELTALTELRALGLARTRLTNTLVETIWSSFPRLLVCDIEHNPCDELVTQDLTYQEMSTYEWFMTGRAVSLEAKYGSRKWIYPSRWPGDDPVDLEMLLARIANAW